MVLSNNAVTRNAGRMLKCAYFKRLINVMLPKVCRLSVDYGLLNVATKTNQVYTPPKGETWAHLDPTVVAASIVHDFGDYQPRYWVTDTYWILTLPTPVGNVNLYFEGKALTVTMPKLLESVVYEQLSNPDLFVTTLLSQQGGAMDDTTLGRSIEGIILKDANEWFFKLLIVASALVTVGYLATS